MTVLVMGATGHVGGAIVGGLREHGVRVRAVSRRPQTWPDGVDGYVADPGQQRGLDNAADGVDAAFVMSGYAAEAGLLAMLAHGAHVVLLSASSAELGASGNQMAAMHLASERAVQASGLPWTFLRPCSFQSNLLRWRDQLTQGNVVRAPFGDVPVAMNDPADVAAVAVLALTTAGHDQAIHRISGPEALTPAAQVALLGAALGRPLTYQPLPDDDGGEAAVDIFRRHADLESTVVPTIQQLLNRPATPLRAWLDRNTTAFDPA